MVDTLQPRFGAGAQPQKPSKSSRGLVPIVDFAVGSHLLATLFLLACAALLFLPYLLWVSFAAVLNFSLASLN